MNRPDLNGATRRWESWAQWATVLVVILAGYWWLAWQLGAMQQQLADVVKDEAAMQTRLERLENRYPFPAQSRVQ